MLTHFTLNLGLWSFRFVKFINAYWMSLLWQYIFFNKSSLILTTSLGIFMWSFESKLEMFISIPFCISNLCFLLMINSLFIFFVYTNNNSFYHTVNLFYKIICPIKLSLVTSFVFQLRVYISLNVYIFLSQGVRLSEQVLQVLAS